MDKDGEFHEGVGDVGAEHDGYEAGGEFVVRVVLLLCQQYAVSDTKRGSRYTGVRA